MHPVSTRVNQQKGVVTMGWLERYINEIEGLAVVHRKRSWDSKAVAIQNYHMGKAEAYRIIASTLAARLAVNEGIIVHKEGD